MTIKELVKKMDLYWSMHTGKPIPESHMTDVLFFNDDSEEYMEIYNECYNKLHHDIKAFIKYMLRYYYFILPLTMEEIEYMMIQKNNKAMLITR